MGIVWTILIGVRSRVAREDVDAGLGPWRFHRNSAIGIGSLLATYGGQALGLYNAGEPAGFVGSLIGAVVLLVLYRVLRGRQG